MKAAAFNEMHNTAMIFGDPYLLFTCLVAIWAFEPGPNGLYFCLRSAREGVPATLGVALGKAMFDAFVMMIVLVGLTGLGDLGVGAYVLKALVALAVVWLVGLNLFNLYNIRKAAGGSVYPAPVKVTPKIFFRHFASGLGWGAMNPVNIALFALFAPLTQDSAVSPELLGKYTLTMLAINLAGLVMFTMGQNAIRKLYRVAWIQVPLHIAGRGSFLAYAFWTVYAAGMVLLAAIQA